MYAIISDRGRQYKVREGELLQVDKLTLEKGAAVTFDKVLLVGKDSAVKVGTPNVSGAKVTGVLEDQIKGKKTISHRRVLSHSIGTRRGHRVKYSVVRIQKIEG